MMNKNLYKKVGKYLELHIVMQMEFELELILTI